jgi:hypothetical protein
MMFAPPKKHTYGRPRLVARIASLFYMQMTFIPQREHVYGSPRPVTEIALLFILLYLQTWAARRWSVGGKRVGEAEEELWLAKSVWDEVE